VDIELPLDLPDEHRARLAWFQENVGKVVPWPVLDDDAMRLSGQGKPIYKPAGWKYALSFKRYLKSRYNDGEVEPLPGGGWTLRYGKSDDDAHGRSYANESVLDCMAAGVPVGVLWQVTDKHHKNGSTFRVLGLATPVSFDGTCFRLVSQEGLSLAAQVETVRSEAEAQEVIDVPGSDYDARQRALREIVARQGRAEFRQALIDAYQGRCAISGCDVRAVLEAAHLRPYRGPESNKVTNGLLLRADLHTLLDYRLLAVDPVTRSVHLSVQLAGTQYETFSGVPLAEPKADSQRPDQRVLDFMWHDFQQVEVELGQPRHSSPGSADAGLS
jgi:hypothetical protein